jgi:hypothetical protein
MVATVKVSMPKGVGNNKAVLAVIGHYESEVCTKDIFYNIISKKFPTFAVHFSNVNSNPVKYL